MLVVSIYMAFGASIHNVWQLERLKGDDMSHMEFRQCIAMGFYTKFGVEPKTAGQSPQHDQMMLAMMV